MNNSKSPLRLPKIRQQKTKLARVDLFESDKNYVRRQNLTGDESKKRLKLLISKKEHGGFRHPTEMNPKRQVIAYTSQQAMMENPRHKAGISIDNKMLYKQEELKHKASMRLKIDELISIKGMSKPNTSVKKEKVSEEQEKLTREFIKAKGYKLKEIEQPKEGDSFIDTTESLNSIKQALEKFKGIFTLKTVQQNFKESVLLLSTDLQPNMAGLFDSIMAVGIIMLRFDTYPSVFFVTDIWKSLLYIVKESMQGRAEVNPNHIKEVFEAMKVYIKLEKLNIASDMATIGQFYSDLYLVEKKEICQLDIFAIKGFVQFVAWLLGNLENFYAEENQALMNTPTKLDFTKAFAITRLVMLGEASQNIFPQPWIEWIGQKCYILMIQFEIWKVAYKSNLNWATLIFDLMFSIFRNPLLGRYVLTKWSETTNSLDAEEIEEEIGNDVSSKNKLAEFMSSFLQFSSLALTESSHIDAFSNQLNILAQLLAHGCLLKDTEDIKAAHQLELDVLCQLNIYVFEIALILKSRSGHEHPSREGLTRYLEAIVNCTVALCVRVQPKDKKICKQMVRNGFHEILSAYKSHKIVGLSKTDNEILERSILKVIENQVV